LLRVAGGAFAIPHCRQLASALVFSQPAAARKATAAALEAGLRAAAAAKQGSNMDDALKVVSVVCGSISEAIRDPQQQQQQDSWTASAEPQQLQLQLHSLLLSCLKVAAASTADSPEADSVSLQRIIASSAVVDAVVQAALAASHAASAGSSNDVLALLLSRSLQLSGRLLAVAAASNRTETAMAQMPGPATAATVAAATASSVAAAAAAALSRLCRHPMRQARI
jgi:hypothetical protein